MSREGRGGGQTAEQDVASMTGDSVYSYSHQVQLSLNHAEVHVVRRALGSSVWTNTEYLLMQHIGSCMNGWWMRVLFLDADNDFFKL